ncbi:MAG: acetate--CoA ligase family protein [Rhizobiaceae bacterium]
MPDLSRLLNPQSIVYVGGSQIAGPIRAARRAGYGGEMLVLNPVRDDIEGIACTKSVSELPITPDAAVIGLSPERAITALAELAKTGCGGAVVMSSGFAELNTDEGRERQQHLIDAAGDMPLLGPNCMGLMNQFSGAFVWGDDNHSERQDGPACAIISQSGALLIGMTGIETAFPLGYGISIGNQAVTTTADLIEAILEDNRIKAIGLYLEGMNEGDPLGQACLKALKQGVPVVALKGGDQAAGAAVAQSHTASMVVGRDLWDAYKNRFGIEEVSSPKALVETLKLLTVSGLPKGNCLSIVSYSGGINGLAATRCGPLGIDLPLPSQENLKWLRENLPETVAVANPIDLNIPYRDSNGGISMQDTSGVADAICRFAEGVSDQVTFFIDVPHPGAGQLDKVWCDSLEALIEVRNNLGLPVSVAGILPEGLPAGFRMHMHDNGVAALLGYSETMEAIATSIRLAKIRENFADQVIPVPLLNGNEITDTVMLDEATSKDALGSFGLATSRYKSVKLENAGDAAGQLGFPVALKVLSNTIAHKAKLGGVKLSLNSLDEVTAAAQKMATDVGSAKNGHKVTHVIVESMVKGASTEIIIGIKRHPAMGLALMIGRGGSQAEEMARFETVLLPLMDTDLDRVFCSLRIASHPAVDALRANCEAVAAYATANANKLVTLDVNPVMLTDDGMAIAADALIVLEKSDGSD